MWMYDGYLWMYDGYMCIYDGYVQWVYGCIYRCMMCICWHRCMYDGYMGM